MQVGVKAVELEPLCFGELAEHGAGFAHGTGLGGGVDGVVKIGDCGFKRDVVRWEVEFVEML